MKKHVPFLLSLLSIMGLLAWTASVRAQCVSEDVLLDLPIDNSSSVDGSGYAHSIDLTGAFSYVNGHDGASSAALQFNSQSEYATIDAHPAFEQMTDAFTIAAWIYPTSMLSDNAFLTKLNGSHRNFVFRFQNNGQLNFHFTRTGGLTFVVSDPGVIVANQWQHVAATWDGMFIRLYVDGVMVKEEVISEGPTFQSSGSIRIATLNFSSERFNGSIDDIQFRSYATSTADIQCLMNSSMPIDQDIVLNLPLDGNATDVSSYGNNGGNNGASASPDRFLTAASSMQFSGTDNISVANQSQYSGLASGFTISAWVKPSAVSGNRVIVAKAGAGRDIVLRVDNGRFTAHYYVGGYVWFTPANATIVANEWTHLACVWDGTTMSLYQDGVEIHSNQPGSTPNFTSNNWYVGALGNTGGENFGGLIDELKVWSRALAPCELLSDIHPAIDLVAEDDLILCAGQTQTVTSTDMCAYLWVNDNSTTNMFEINADDLGVGDHEIVLEAYDTYDNFYSDTVHVNVSLCTGIEESQNDRAMKLMPNPASHSVTVMATELTEVRLTDLSGRLIRSLVPANSDRAVIEVADLPSGIYLITAIDAEGTAQVERLMKH